MDQLGGVSQRCLNVFGPEGRIAREDRFYRRTLAKAVQNDRNWNPRAFRAEFASTDLGVAAKKLLPIGHFPVLRSNELRRETGHHKAFHA